MTNKEISVRILMIDDDEDVYLLVKRRLLNDKYLSCTIDWISSFDDAVEAIPKNMYDVYLVDQKLEDGEGLDILKLLSHPLYRGCARIMLTNSGSDALEKQAYEIGISEYITKDQINTGILVYAIRAAVEREQQRKALIESEERFTLAAIGSNDGLWDWNIETNSLYVSPRWLELIGYDPDEFDGSLNSWKQLVHEDDIEGMCKQLKDHLKDPIKQFQYHFRYLLSNGSYFWALLRGVAIRDEERVSIRMTGSLTNIHQMKVLEDQLRHRLLHDGLTKLPNRDLFFDRVNRMLESSKRSPLHSFAVLFLDLNKFKTINDTLGHQFGDILLKVVAQKLAENLRGEDSIARLSGDEFAILCSLIDGVSSLYSLVERIENSLKTKIVLEGHVISVSASIGATLGPGQYETADEMIRDADIAMYRSKATGKFTMFNDSFVPSLEGVDLW